MENFGTICSWKIRSLHINRVKTLALLENSSTKEWFFLKSIYLLHVIPHILVIRTEKHTGRLKQDL